MSGHEECGILQRRGLGMGGCSSGVHVVTLLVSFASPLLTSHLAVLLDGKLWKEPFILLGIVVLTWVGQLLAGKGNGSDVGAKKSRFVLLRPVSVEYFWMESSGRNLLSCWELWY